MLDQSLKDINSTSNNLIRFAKNEKGVLKKYIDLVYEYIDELYNIPHSLIIASEVETEEMNSLCNTYMSENGSKSIFGKVNSIEVLTNKFLKKFQNYKEVYQGFSDNILEKMSAITDIHETIEKMKDISKEIKLFSINSVIVSSSAGSQGLGFKSISRFIIELSDAIQKSALQLEIFEEKISNAQSVLKNQFSHLIDVVYEKKLNEFTQHVTDKSKIVSKNTAKMSEYLININNALQGMLKKFSALSSQKSYVLHYTSSLLEMLSDLNTYPENISSKEVMNRLAFIIYFLNEQNTVGSITKGVVDNMRNKLIPTYTQFLHQFSNFHQDQFNIFKFLTQKNRGWDPLIPSIFQDMSSMIGGMSDMIEEENAVKSHITQIFLEIEKIYYEGQAFFNSFEKFFVTMNNINILAQIELNKNNFDSSSNTGMKQKFNIMLQQIKEFHEEIKNKIQKLLASFISEIAKFNEAQARQDFDMKYFSSALELEQSQINFLSDAIAKDIKTLTSESNKIRVVEKESELVVEKVNEITQRATTHVLKIINYFEKEYYYFHELTKKYNINDYKKYEENNSTLTQYINKQALYLQEIERVFKLSKKGN